MEELRYLPYEEAKKLVSDIVEMEHPTDDGRRIFNVYNQRGESVCWFDADEVEEEIDAEEFEEVKKHILHFIPEWAD
jgi:DNA-directed RNA polymerase subunit F